MFIRQNSPPSGGSGQGTTPFTGIPIEYNPYESNGKNMLTITGTMTSLALLAVLVRLHVRGIMLKSVGIDDYIIVFSMYVETVIQFLSTAYTL
jgi:hypothetical protein